MGHWVFEVNRLDTTPSSRDDTGSVQVAVQDQLQSGSYVAGPTMAKVPSVYRNLGSCWNTWKPFCRAAEQQLELDRGGYLQWRLNCV